MGPMRSNGTALDTRRVPPSQRHDYWSSGIAERFFPMQVDAIVASPFDARLATGIVGPLAVGAIQGRPHRVIRTPSMIAAGDPRSILLYLLTRGTVRLEQDDRACVMAPGDIACHDTSRPSAFEAQEMFNVIVFSVPRWFIGANAETVAMRTALAPSKDRTALARLAAPLLLGVAEAAIHGQGLAEIDAEGAAEMVLPILRTAFGAAPVDAGAPSALLARMKHYALQHLTEPDIGPVRLADAHFVSTRYVHKLFASSGSGVSEWIRDRRLDGAEAELRRSPEVPIATVAERWGYRNPTSFSRAFRDRHGRTPRELRGLGLTA